jgi:hypothetical protein
VQLFVLEERSLADTSALTPRTRGSLKVNLHRALKHGWELRLTGDFG